MIKSLSCAPAFTTIISSSPQSFVQPPPPQAFTPPQARTPSPFVPAFNRPNSQGVPTWSAVLPPLSSLHPKRPHDASALVNDPFARGLGIVDLFTKTPSPPPSSTPPNLTKPKQ